ncbi:MAG: repressor LexA [Thermotogaceae bacterium]|nr:repressor LexA [Thermotogaceae bacterium]
MRKLTEKQKKVLQFIEEYMDKYGYPPSIRDIARRFRITPRGAQMHLKALEKKGVIKRKDGKARALKITKRTDAMLLPVLGEIAAGEAIEMIPESEEEIEVPKTMVAVGYEHFVLRVRGESMIGDHIMDGDYVIIRKQSTANVGDIVAVSIDNSEATLKRLKYENNMVRLEPSNPDMEPIVIEPERVKILGKLVGVIRIL